MQAKDQQRLISIGFIDNEVKPGIHNMPYRDKLVNAALSMAEKDWRLKSGKKYYNIQIKKYFFGEKLIDARRALDEAIKGETVAGLGLATSGHASIAAPLLKGTDYTVISPCASANPLRAYYPNLLLLSDTTVVEGRALAIFIDEHLQAKRPLAVVAWNDPYSRGLFESMPELSKSKFKLIKVLDDTKDLARVAGEVVEYGPDVVFLPLFGVFSGHLVREITQKGFKGIFAGGESWGETNGKAFQLITQNLEFTAFEVRYPSRYYLSPRQKLFSKRLSDEYGVTFSPLAMNIYDGLLFLFESINSIPDNLTRKKLQKVLTLAPLIKGHINDTICLRDDFCTERRYSIIKADKNGFVPYKQFVVTR
ncbi:MAG: ABC transporter substrate-binding protein [Deltaproteobacteria bacterium]|nr:ABC transporter substrate-binding protein [Deltaproteobacteria bacterium]